MDKESYLYKYVFDWQTLDIVLGGKSSLDSKYFVGIVENKAQGADFLRGYGLSPDDRVASAELFGNFQEALQFIRRYFLKEGNPDGLDFKIPNSLYMINDITDLFMMASKHAKNEEDRLWAEIVLKVMHTILHVDKDLRSKYFSIIQTQIFDRYYRFINRDGENRLYLGTKDSADANFKIPLVNFETKDKKSRDSIIIKLMHKVDNVAEELFDRIGLRIVTRNKFDTLRVVKFLVEKNIIVPHNNKPSRAINTLINLEDFKKRYNNLMKVAIRNGLSEDRFVQALEREAEESPVDKQRIPINEHTAKAYNSIQFTCRHLVKYVNPFFKDFKTLRDMAQGPERESVLAKKILSMDMSLIAGDVRFFYPYEVQVVDEQSHRENTLGRASHQEYKRGQVQSAMLRIFSPLLKFKNKELN